MTTPPQHTTITTLLTINGSSPMGESGLALDIQTIHAMGGHPLTVPTSIVMPQSEGKGHHIYDLPAHIVSKQIDSAISASHPKVVKIGLIRGEQNVHAVAKAIVGIRHKVLAPGIISSQGERLVDEPTLKAIQRHLLPQADLLILRQSEAQLMLGHTIDTNERMLQAAHTLAHWGAKHILIRSGRIHQGRVTALLWPQGTFFSSYNIEGWQQHGVGGALSAAIAMSIALGDDIPTAITTAHQYIHSQVVYSVSPQGQNTRQADIYNHFMNLLAAHHTQAHDVAYYAQNMNITTRYLSQSTERIVAKSPKRLIDEYLMNQARQQLLCTRHTVQEISIQLGFATQTTFNTFFRKHQGCSPTIFRNQPNTPTTPN